MISSGSGETIVASAAPAGLGALSIVRLSGGDAAAIGSRVMTGALPRTRVASRRALRTRSGSDLDDAVVIRYEAPHSYTGEDTVEFICHGGWVTVTRIVAALVEAGARPAEPGEFTRRAVLNGKLDLLQAEAVNDLIRAETSAGASQALKQLDGGLSRRIEMLRESVLNLEALICYEIDFPEEDDGPISNEKVEQELEATIESTEQLIRTTPVGELVRTGAIVAIVGGPNVGKSSLFNALLGRRRALVTDIPGTTRDAVEAVLDVQPIPLRLVDTAGLRESEDRVERLGMTVSHDYVERAAVVLVCGDSGESLKEGLEAVGEAADGRLLRVRTKIDLRVQEDRKERDWDHAVSAWTGAGLEDLLAGVARTLTRGMPLPGAETPMVTHTRYRQILERARTELMAFREARRQERAPATVSAVHLREATRVLEELIGGVEVEEILARVFSSFCIGK